MYWHWITWQFNAVIYRLNVNQYTKIMYCKAELMKDKLYTSRSKAAAKGLNMNQVGARFLRKQRTREPDCNGITTHVKKESKLKRLKSGAVKRIK